MLQSVAAAVAAVNPKSSTSSRVKKRIWHHLDSNQGATDLKAKILPMCHGGLYIKLH
jgi:hypothetical protein